MNYQNMWFLLKEYIDGKTSHGKNELSKQMEKLEIDEAKRTWVGPNTERQGK